MLGQVGSLYDTFGGEKVLEESVQLQRGCGILLGEEEIMAFCLECGRREIQSVEDRQTQHRFLPCL